eukprot:jgi/Mesen1/10450/ME000082S09951
MSAILAPAAKVARSVYLLESFSARKSTVLPTCSCVCQVSSRLKRYASNLIKQEPQGSRLAACGLVGPGCVGDTRLTYAPTTGVRWSNRFMRTEVNNVVCEARQGGCTEAEVHAGKESPLGPAVSSGTSSTRTFLIGVAGGTASGKTSVCRKIMEQLESQHQGSLVSLSQDCFYRDLTPAKLADISSYNFDHPDAFDFPELLAALQKLKRREHVEIPQYDYVTSSRLPLTTPISGANVVLLEGILIFHHVEIRDLFDMKLFVDTDADTRLARRMRRDIVERGRDVIQVLDRYERSVKPSFEQYIYPTKKFADIIVPRGAENVVAINLIVQHIQGLLLEATRRGS